MAPRQMSNQGETQVTEADLSTASARLRRSTRGVVPACLLLQAAIVLLATWLVTTLAPRSDGLALGAWIAAVCAVILTPLVVGVSAVASRHTLRLLAQSLARQRELGEEAVRREFENQLSNALEMADDEDRVMAVAGRALSRIVGDDGRAEVLLADNSHSHLERTLVTGPSPDGAGCRVESPDQCVAARRGRTQSFPDSDALDACPHLQGRELGRCAAVCVPVSIMGRAVGIVHRAEPLPARLSDPTAAQFEVLAKQLGARLGLVRVMGETRLQASTDGLTGLPNRRAFENQIRQMRNAGADHCLVLADLDAFKLLNDSHGHEAGDRALRVYAGVLKASLRPHDLACRLGGEEFALALSGCSPTDALAACERLRDALAVACQSGGAPPFTASYGIAPWDGVQTLEELLAATDAALYRAKRNGRNQAAIHDPAIDTESRHLLVN